MISLLPSCDKCGREHSLFFASRVDMIERIVLDGWFADEIVIWCPDCSTKNRASPWMSLYPDHRPCSSCGRAIFVAWFRNRRVVWSAAPDQRCGNAIKYEKSGPQSIVMGTYYKINDPRPDNCPVFGHHRCRERDRVTYQGQLSSGIVGAAGSLSNIVTNFRLTNSLTNVTSNP